MCAQQPAPQAIWQGILRDPAGAPIPGAKVRLTSSAATAEATTAADGHFHLAVLPPGSYRLYVRAEGRQVDLTQTIDLVPTSPPVAITLSARGELTVTVLQGQSATGGEELSSQAVSELPLNKRDFGTLLLLAAGTMTDANGAANFTAQFAINGQRGVEATFAMDGADISDPEMGGATFSNFNVDAVEEIQSSSGWMPAEIGRGAAGFTNIVTRSGASGFHGSIFEFLRNSAFDARNYFDHPTPAYPGRIPPFRRNEFGFTNGGPVFVPRVYDGRKRTFYFAQYQGFRQVLGTTQVMPVPTAAERAGIDVVTYPDGSTDTLTVPVDPGIAAILARYPLPNDPAGAFRMRTPMRPLPRSPPTPTSFRCASTTGSRPKTSSLRASRSTISPAPPPIPTRRPSIRRLAFEYIDRQRNVVGTFTRTVSPRLIIESLHRHHALHTGISHAPTDRPRGQIQRWTCSRPSTAAGGSVMQAYGNLFQGRQNLSTLLAATPSRPDSKPASIAIPPTSASVPTANTTLAEARPTPPKPFPRQAAGTIIQPGDPLPDTLSSFLSGSPFVYTIAIAPPYFSSGPHIGPAAINRNDFNLYAPGHLEGHAALHARLRPALGTLHAHRRTRPAHLRFPQRQWRRRSLSSILSPAYRTNWNGFGPRIQAAWQVTRQLTRSRRRRHYRDPAQYLAG